jgi:hypothetical protein
VVLLLDLELLVVQVFMEWLWQVAVILATTQHLVMVVVQVDQQRQQEETQELYLL